MPTQHDPIRNHVADLLAWKNAHVTFDEAFESIPPDLYGVQPDDLPYSLWQLLEHIRLAQHDVLEFCRNTDYVTPDWPDDYWPDGTAPPSPRDWAEALVSYRTDREALIQIAKNADIDLASPIPHGDGQTYLRELLLVADHTAYHVGEVIVVRRLLGIWPS